MTMCMSVDHFLRYTDSVTAKKSLVCVKIALLDLPMYGSVWDGVFKKFIFIESRMSVQSLEVIALTHRPFGKGGQSGQLANIRTLITTFSCQNVVVGAVE